MRWKTLAFAAPLICCAAPHARAQSPVPSDAFIATQQAYETAFLARTYLDEDLGIAEVMSALLDAATLAAAETYAHDWPIVAAEAQRRLALLRPFDLAPYAAQIPTQPWAHVDQYSKQTFAQAASSPARLAAIQFYDPRMVAYVMFNMIVSQNLEAGDLQRNIMIGAYAPLQAYSVTHNDRPAIAATNGPFVLVIPYEITQEGLILPDPEEIIYFRRG